MCIGAYTRVKKPHSSNAAIACMVVMCWLPPQLYLVDEDCPSFLCDELEGLLTWRQTSRCRDALKQLSSPLSILPSPLLPNGIPQLQLLIRQPNSDIEVSRSGSTSACQCAVGSNVHAVHRGHRLTMPAMCVSMPSVCFSVCSSTLHRSL